MEASDLDAGSCNVRKIVDNYQGIKQEFKQLLEFCR